MRLLLLASLFFVLFFFTAPATTELYTLSLHDALPISSSFECKRRARDNCPGYFYTHSVSSNGFDDTERSEEHTSELQSRGHLVCRLLLEKKKKKAKNTRYQSIAGTQTSLSTYD